MVHKLYEVQKNDFYITDIPMYINNGQCLNLTDEYLSWQLWNRTGYSIEWINSFSAESIDMDAVKRYHSTERFQGFCEYNEWKGFWMIEKVDNEAANATYHHLFVTNAPNATHQVILNEQDTKDRDHDWVINVKGFSSGHIMWTTAPYHWTSNEVMIKLVQKIHDSFGMKQE